MDNQLQVILTEQNVIGANAQALIEAFGAPFTEAGDILRTYKDIVVTDESQTKEMSEAKDKRLTLKKIRTGVENKRKELKEESLKTGKAIDSVARYIKENIEPAEKYLELQEKFAEIKKAERQAKIKQERTEKLMQFTDNISMYNIENIEDETFEFLLAKVKKEHDDRVASEKAEAERVEKERLEKEAEDKRIREENDRLRKEAEEREKAIEAERAIEAEKQAKIEAERQKELAEERAKVEAERAKLQAIEDAKLAEEEKARKIKEAKEAEELKALLSPDKDKLLNFSNALEIIIKEKLPAVKTKQAQDIIDFIDDSLTNIKNTIDLMSSKL